MKSPLRGRAGSQADGLRALPAVDLLLREARRLGLVDGVPAPVAASLARRAIGELRSRLAGAPEPGPAAGGAGRVGDEAVERLARLARSYRLGRLQPVINATGVVLHTNLGRAVLPARAMEAVARAAGSYTNLELDLEAGSRGRRESRLEPLLSALTGAEAALVVNNNAAAVLLVLSAVGAGREVVVSRGELIEIGGEFRMPDVMAQSGCRLVEVGTTNRTRLCDYETAIAPQTAAILKVHPSNYRILGFTGSVEARALAQLARARGIRLLVDLGSGCLVESQRYGLAHEPTVAEMVRAGADAVTFSGDKLLGGPQAGIVVGSRAVVDAARRHPLVRALRVDKMTVAALESVLALYGEGREQEIPVWAMLGVPLPELERRAGRLAGRLQQALAGSAPAGGAAGSVEVEVAPSEAAVGGGSLPGEVLESRALCLRPRPGGPGPQDLAAALRQARPPVVGRVAEGALWLDLRTVLPEQDELLFAALVGVLTPSAGG